VKPVQYGKPANKKALAKSMGLFCLPFSRRKDTPDNVALFIVTKLYQSEEILEGMNERGS